jgi:WD40 repeat protein
MTIATDETLASDLSPSTSPTQASDLTRPPSDRAVAVEPLPSPLPTDPAHLPLVPASAYTLLDEVGRGGLGRIVRARDTRTGRIVAIKEMRVDSVDPATRFVREALVTANLQHPAIVPVYEVGRWSPGRPFYAMKLVTGRPLSQVIAAATTLDARLALLPHLIAVAHAMAHAHGERVIHRDLKPANVMIGAHGETVVIDWGLARRLDQGDADSLPPLGDSAPGETVVGSILGTPQYMAPEQAHGERVDERADVYAIGAMLYHLLAGRPPFDGLASASVVIEAVRSRPPAPVAGLAPGAPRDLIAIVTRAMARDTGARYATAAALADDLRRFATGQLVSAHRYSRGERLRRFARRYRAVLASAAIAVVALAATGAVSVQRVVREREAARAAERGQRAARTEAEAQRSEAQLQLASSLIERARNELDRRQPGRAAPLLASAAELDPQRDDLAYLQARAAAALPEVHALSLGEVTAVANLPGGDVVLARVRGLERRALRDGTIRWQRPLRPVSELLLRGDTAIAVTDRGAVEIALDDGRELARFGELDAGGDLLSGELSPDRRWLAIKGPSGEVEVWDVPARRLAGRMHTGLPRGYASPSPDGRHVVVTAGGHDSSGAYLYDVRSGRRLHALCPPDQGCGREPFSAEAIVLLRDRHSGGGEASVFDWNGRHRFTIETSHSLFDARISARERLVVVLAADGTLQAHELDSGRRRWTTSGLIQGYGMVLDDDDGRLWAFGRGGEVVLVDLATGGELGWWWTPQTPIGVFPSLEGDTVTIVDERLHAYWWVPGDAGVRLFAPTPGRVWRTAWLDDARLVTGSDDGTVAVHDAATGAVRTRLGAHGARISDLAALPGGLVVSAGRDDRVIMWDAVAGRALWTLEHAGVRAAPSPDGRRLVIVNAAGDVALHPLDAPDRRRVLGTLPRDIMFTRWSPDGRWIAAIDDGGTTIVWRAEDGAEVRRLTGLPRPRTGGMDIGFSPDSRWLFAARAGPRVLIDLHGGPDVALEGGGEHMTWGVAFSPDSGRVASNDDAGDVTVWSVATGARVLRITAPAVSPMLRFSPDGKTLIGGGLDHVARAWDLERGVLLATYDAIDEIFMLDWNPAGTHLALTTLRAAATWRPR